MPKMPAAFFRNHLTPDIHSVEERRVRRQAGDLGESEDEWKREFKTEWRSKSG
jgi:hypothetical protein